ncbi:WD40/YVTN/BNR-like repeat-containing protein, partial [Pseudomonas aeruginosa]
ILATTDGGQKWQTQRLVVTEDRPLFAVHFFNDKRGVAVGLWSLVLTTQDSGETWVEQKLNPKDKALSDLNLLNLFPGTKSDIYATSERG